MSYNEDEDQPREEDAAGAEELDYDSIFQFFSQFTKRLVLELPSAEDRALAAAWVQRLEAEPETEEEKRLRVNYLKLLLFVMQRGRLIGIFKKDPPSEPLLPFPQGFGLSEMGNLLLEQAELQGSGDSNGAGVSYSVEISNDLKEFVAAQEIPNFGIQVYYAWSMEDPIHKWSSFDEKKFPQYVRDKIMQLKVKNSEEKTNVQSCAKLRDKYEGSLKKSCDSSLYTKFRTKVKSPEEIEKSQDRNYQAYMSFSEQKGYGGSKEKCSEDDRSLLSPKKSRSSKKSSSNVSSQKMDLNMSGIARFCGKRMTSSRCNNADESEEQDSQCEPEGPSGGMRAPCSSDKLESPAKHGGCKCAQPQRKADAETSKRLQKCDDGGENEFSYMNETSCMAGQSPRNAERCGGEMYSESGRCGGEPTPAEKPPCGSMRGYQTTSPASQPCMKSRKTKCSAQGSMSNEQNVAPGFCCQGRQMSKKDIQSSQEDSGKKWSCPKESGQAHNRMDSSYRCPKVEKEAPTREGTCKRKEKSSSEKACPKTKPVDCSMKQRAQEPECPAFEDAVKSCSRKRDQMQIPPKHIEGCICNAENLRKQEIEKLSRITQRKTASDPCGQEMTPPQQQHSCSGRKFSERPEKRQPANYGSCGRPQDDSIPTPCSENRTRNVDPVCEPRKKADVSRDVCGSSPPKVAYCPRGKKSQETRGPTRPCPNDHESMNGPCHGRNQDVDMGTYMSSMRNQGGYPDRRCEGDKSMKYSPTRQQQQQQQQQQQECSLNDMSRSGKGQYQNELYTLMNESDVKSPKKQQSNACKWGNDDAEKNECSDEFDDDFSSASEGGMDDMDGQDDICNDMANMACENCDIHDGPFDSAACGYSPSSDNIMDRNGSLCQNFDDYEPTEYKKLPSQMRPNYGGPPQNKYIIRPCPVADEPFTPPRVQPQNNYSQGMEQCPRMPAARQKQSYMSDQKCGTPSHRKKAIEPQDYMSPCEQSNWKNFATSTPCGNPPPPPDFNMSAIRSNANQQRSRYNTLQQEPDAEECPVSNRYGSGRTQSPMKDYTNRGQRKVSQENQCYRPPRTTATRSKQFMATHYPNDDDAMDKSRMDQFNQCSTPTAIDASYRENPPNWVELRGKLCSQNLPNDDDSC